MQKIISGGQTGVDRAALDAAIALGIPHGGWCPRGRLAEDGRIPETYELEETRSSEYPVRTERNVLESDATLILYRTELSGGTELTRQLAHRHRKPYLAIDLESPSPLVDVHDWLRDFQIEVLNVAGPRESQSPGIGHDAGQFLRQLLSDQ